MRDKALNKINNNITNLNAIAIVDDHDDQWIKQQLINKHHMLLQYVNEGIDTNMEQFCQVIRDVQIEVDDLIAKWH